MKPVERLPVYENLLALNGDFEQVLVDLAQLQELGVFQRDLGHIFSVVVKETRAWANMEIAEFLQMREEDAWAYFGQLHNRWEKKLRDPNDVLIEAELLLEKPGSSGTEEKQAKAPQRWIEGRMSRNLNFLHIIGGVVPVRNPASHPPAAEPGACPSPCRRSKPRTNSKGTAYDCSVDNTAQCCSHACISGENQNLVHRNYIRNTSTTECF